MTGITEILLVANSLIHLSPDARPQPWQLFSTRLGMAAMLISPVIVATSVEAINNWSNGWRSALTLIFRPAFTRAPVWARR